MNPHRPDRARGAVVSALSKAAATFPLVGPLQLEDRDLSSLDSALATAVLRCCLQRWLTIEGLLDQWLRCPARQVEPPLRAVLLAGGAQLLFFDRLPARAVVHTSVALARQHVRPGAGGLVNAVLRRIAEMVVRRSSQQWHPAADRLPLDAGSVQLAQACLPDPAHLVTHLAMATSHPRVLVNRWLGRFGADQTVQLCLHGLKTPPTFLFGAQGPLPWHGTHQELVARLESDPALRVQDPAAALAVQATGQLQPRTIVDFCAGLGTKTRQLALLHPDARVHAMDVNPQKLEALRRSVSALPSVTVEAGPPGPRPVDLMVLDVPCSNTAVLCRRPEARYRFSRKSVASLVQRQRQIIDQAITRVRSGGWVLYCTCSLEPEENEQQVDWIGRRHHTSLLQQSLTLPDGAGPSYHDGAFYALMCCP